MSMVRPFFRFEVTKFVILFVERAGSTFLVTALKSHPEVRAVTEKFDAMRDEGKAAADQLSWAREFLTPPVFGPHRAVGFKSKLVDVLDQDGFAQLLRERSCRVICLQRLNSIKAVVSTINARRQFEMSGYWNLLKESHRLPAFAVDLDEFDLLLKQREKMNGELGNYVDQLKLPTLRLQYEDLLHSRDKFLHQVFHFLGVPVKSAQGMTLKNTKDDLREAILNFDELRKKYHGTRYESMFDEVLLAS